MPAKDASGSDRKFVVKQPITTIPTVGHVFTEAEFRDAHPLPSDPKAAALLGDGYHDTLLNRLIHSGAIEVAPDESQPQPLPVSPAQLNRESQAMVDAAKAAPPLPVSPAVPKK